MTDQPSKPNYWVLVIGFSLIIPVVIILASGFGTNPRAIPSTMESKPAPDFSLVDLTGNPVNLDALRGKYVVLNFWSTWCQPCKMEHGLLQQAQRDNPDIQFYGILYSDTPDKAERYLTKVGAAYPTLVDEGNRVAIDYGVAGVPETFFIDATGTIQAKHTGPLTWPSLAERLEQLRTQ